MKIKNNITGEIIEIPESSGDAIDQRIEGRGQESFGQAYNKIIGSEPFSGKRVGAIANMIGKPGERVEAAVANAALELQAGRMDNFAKAFSDGLSGRREAEIGDVFRKAGVPEAASATIGMVVAFGAPIMVMNRAIKMVSGVSRITDRGIKYAGKKLLSGADDAVMKLGSKVDDAYKPVNNLLGSGDDLINALDDAPSILINNIEKQLGKNIDDIALSRPSVGQLREIKKIIGELKPTSFGKETRGLVESIEAKNVNKTYGNIKRLIQQTLESNGLKKEARHILDADESFTNAIRASDYIRKKVVDPTLLKPTKAGSIARGILTKGDVSTRDALNTLINVGGKARRDINAAISSLNKYNSIMAIGRVSGTLGRAGMYGAVTGAVINRPLKGALETIGIDTGAGEQ